MYFLCIHILCLTALPTKDKFTIYKLHILQLLAHTVNTIYSHHKTYKLSVEAKRYHSTKNNMKNNFIHFIYSWIYWQRCLNVINRHVSYKIAIFACERGKGGVWGGGGGGEQKKNGSMSLNDLLGSRRKGWTISGKYTVCGKM